MNVTIACRAVETSRMNQVLVSTAAAREVHRYGRKMRKRNVGVYVFPQTIPSVVTSIMCSRVPVSSPVMAFTFAMEETSEGKHGLASAQILTGHWWDGCKTSPGGKQTQLIHEGIHEGTPTKLV